MTNGSEFNGFTLEEPERAARLAEVLIQRNLATEEQLNEALGDDGLDVGDSLVRRGILGERDLIDARAEVYGMAVADLRQTDPDPEALSLIPDSVAREHFVIPLLLDPEGLHVAMADEPSTSF